MALPHAPDGERDMLRGREPSTTRAVLGRWRTWVFADAMLLLAVWGGLFLRPPGDPASASTNATASAPGGPPSALTLPAIAVPPPRAPAGRSVVDQDRIARAVARAEQLAPVSSLLVMRGDELVVERYFRGMRANRTTNLKSISKTLLSPLIGIAIADGVLEGPDQPLRELLPDYYARLADGGRDAVAKQELTLHHVLSMTSGIESTSFGNYGAWVSSRDWVWDQLRRPMVCRPGCFEYSTGSTHLLSAILTRTTGESLKSYAERVFFGELGIRLPEWDRDPQGRYLGGNNMALTPRQLLRVGEVFRDRGRWQNRQLVPEDWIELSWRPRATSPWNGHRYGYLWWSESWGGHTANFAWGYGGQYLVIVPDLDLVAVVTSSLSGTRGGHTRRLRDFFDEYLIPAFASSDTDAGEVTPAGRGR